MKHSQYSNKIFIIAEAAVNGFGSEYIVQKTIDAAKNSGADAIKFQHIHVEEVYAPGKYKYGKYNIDDVRDLREKGLMSINEIKKIVEYSDKIGIKAFFTPFGLKALKELQECNVNIIKIASADLEYDELVEEAISTGLDLILSTGMISSIDLKKRLDYLNNKNISDRTTIMHCVGEYPHDIESSQIGAIEFLKSNFDGLIGYSDHTLGTESAVASLSLGANIFEKHFTLSRNLGGLDSKHSLEPNELKSYIDKLNKVKKALEIKTRNFSKGEQFTSERAMRGVYAANFLKAGSIITSDDLLYLRPIQGFKHQQRNIVIGKKAKYDINKFEPFSNKNIL